LLISTIDVRPARGRTWHGGVAQEAVRGDAPECEPAGGVFWVSTPQVVEVGLEVEI
jgi:hypothetical protein